MKKIFTIIVVPIVVLFLYWFFSYFNQSFKQDLVVINEATEPTTTKKEESGATEKTSASTPTKETTTTKKAQEYSDIEEYIVGVVACEMPALYEEEALKAQAVAARTFAQYRLSQNPNANLESESDQCYINASAQKEKWGSNYQVYYDKIKNAVASVKNVIMTQNNKLFKSFYFSTSNGKTETSLSVFGEGNLQSVDSSWDKESKNYEVQTDFLQDELITLLGDFTTITIKERDTTNHVTKVSIDNKEMSGIEFRKALSLRSTDFDITKNDNRYVITTYGYGHGVGMSQYGANYLAKSGKKYNEILKHYYNDINLKTY